MDTSNQTKHPIDSNAVFRPLARSFAKPLLGAVIGLVYLGLISLGHPEECVFTELKPASQPVYFSNDHNHQLIRLEPLIGLKSLFSFKPSH